MRKLLLLKVFILISFSQVSFGQTIADSGYNIRIKLANYANDTLFLGYQMGNQSFISDTALLNKKSGEFSFRGTKKLNGGAYILILRPKNDVIQIMINESEEDFYFHSGAINSYANTKTNSKDNIIFLNYLSFLKEKSQAAEKLLTMRAEKNQHLLVSKHLTLRHF